MVRDFNTHNHANDSKDNEEYDEAYPSLFTSSAGRANSLLRVTKAEDTISSRSFRVVKCISPSLYVLLDFASLSLDDIDGLILLLNQNAHLMLNMVIRQVIFPSK